MDARVFSGSDRSPRAEACAGRAPGGAAGQLLAVGTRPLARSGAPQRTPGCQVALYQRSRLSRDADPATLLVHPGGAEPESVEGMEAGKRNGAELSRPAGG